MLRGADGHRFPIRVATATLAMLVEVLQQRTAPPVCVVAPLTLDDLDDMVDLGLAAGRIGRDSDECVRSPFI